jgi:hypothetical protein
MYHSFFFFKSSLQQDTFIFNLHLSLKIVTLILSQFLTWTYHFFGPYVGFLSAVYGESMNKSSELHLNEINETFSVLFSIATKKV